MSEDVVCGSLLLFFFQAEDGIRDYKVTGVQTCALPIYLSFPEIGKLFNDKHHSTVMYSVEKIDQLRAGDADLDRTLQHIRSEERRVGKESRSRWWPHS